MNRLFFKLQLIAGIPFGLLIGIISLQQGKLFDVLLNGILSGLVFGTIVSYILVSLHRALSRRVVPDASIADFDMHQERYIELNMPFEQAFSLCLQSLNTINRCRVMSSNHDHGDIKARTGLNWKTWGDDIQIKLTKGRNNTEINISSRPSARSTLVDFGKNLDNVEKIRRYLLEY